jgi:aprataxin
MEPKAKKVKSESPAPVRRATAVFYGRDGLGAYTHDPASFPRSRVIYHNEGFVAIHDLYPKSSVHTLLLPRSERSLLHPFDAFEDTTFLREVQREAEVLRQLVAKELRRKYGQFSVQEQARERALNGLDEVPEGQDLPMGRDWAKDVKVGIHAHPSMNHLHVHVLSVDHYSECLKHRRHYNSFVTPFLVPLEAFPLSPDDPRRYESYLDGDLICWRCGKDFGRSFAKLKLHLAEEFEKWKAA